MSAEVLRDDPPEPAEKLRPWLAPLECLVLLAAAIGVLGRIVPPFAAVYLKVKIHLPAMTKTLIGLSEVVQLHPVCVGCLLILIPWSLHGLGVRGTKISGAVLAVLSLAFLFWTLLALFLPLIGELEAIRPPRHS